MGWTGVAATEPREHRGGALHGRAVDAAPEATRRAPWQTVRTTIADDAASRPLDRVNRQFHAVRPNPLWVSDFTDVSTWQGWVYVAFVIDVYARRIVGWQVSAAMTTDFVLDAHPGKPGNPSNWRHWNGSLGSTITACIRLSATFPLPRLR